MSANTSPLPDEMDVHLVVRLGGVLLHFSACLTAALIFIQDQELHHSVDAVTVLGGDTAGLRRLPSERLYLEP